MCVYWVAQLPGQTRGSIRTFICTEIFHFLHIFFKKKCFNCISMKPFLWRKQTFRFLLPLASSCVHIPQPVRTNFRSLHLVLCKNCTRVARSLPTFLYDCMTELFFLRSEPPSMPPTDRVEILNGGKLLNVPQAMERTISLQDEALQCSIKQLNTCPQHATKNPTNIDILQISFAEC